MKKNDLAIALFAAMICVFLVVEPASANVLDNFGTAVLGILNNVFLRTVAIVAIIVTGVMALTGRMEWQRFIYVLLGVVIIFGAAGIVDFIRTNSTTVQLINPTTIIRVV
ncbi:MAG: type IV secretion system protein VirB2 [Desulforhopalus sp.]|nr:type IV secretion system protein VirB2 [Desulforhopalus sp.]